MPVNRIDCPPKEETTVQSLESLALALNQLIADTTKKNKGTTAEKAQKILAAAQHLLTALLRLIKEATGNPNLLSERRKAIEEHYKNFNGLVGYYREMTSDDEEETEEETDSNVAEPARVEIKSENKDKCRREATTNYALEFDAILKVMAVPGNYKRSTAHPPFEPNITNHKSVFVKAPMTYKTRLEKGASSTGYFLHYDMAWKSDELKLIIKLKEVKQG